MLRSAATKPGKRNRVLHIGDISADTKDADLREYFARFGTVSDVAVVTQDTKLIGLVEMATKPMVQQAIDSGNHCIRGNYVTVRGASGKEKGLLSRIRNRHVLFHCSHSYLFNANELMYFHLYV